MNALTGHRRGGRRRFALLLTLFAGLAGLTVVTAQPAGAAPVATTFVTMVSEQGDYIGQGSSRLWRTGSGSIGLSGSVTGVVSVSVSGGPSSDYFTMNFAAAEGQTFTAGQYDHAERTPFATAGHPGIDISGDGRGCNTIGGRFTVLDVDAALTRLWLVYEQHCENGDPALFGEIRINEPGGDSDLLVAPGQIAWPDEYPGASGRVVPVRLVNTGASPVTVSSAAITAGAPHFTVASNGCTTIAVGSSCVVNAGFAPTTAGAHTGTLTITDSTGAGTHTVQLGGTGIAGHTSWAMRSETGDYIGQGHDWSWTPQDGDTIVASGSETVVHAYNGTFTADFEAPNGQILQPGSTYPNATRYPFNGTGVGLDVSGDGRGCNQLTGSFTVHEVSFDEGGHLEKLSVTFEQHCEGGTAALFGSIAWKADNAAHALPPRIVVTSNKGTYSYQEGAVITVTISNDSVNRTVNVFATPYGNLTQLVKTGTVDSSGKLTVTVPVVRRTLFTASIQGSSVPSSLITKRVVTVRAKVVPKMINYVGRNGSYYLYKASGNAVIKGTVSPNHAGDCLWFRAQVFANGAWHLLGTTDCVHMAPESWAKGVLKGDSRLIGFPIRMRAEWKGNPENAAANSAWVYAKFVH